MAPRMRLLTSDKLIEAVMQVAQARGLLGVEAALERGDLFQGAAEREQIARAGGAEGHLGEQAFQIENAGELLAQFGAQDGLLAQFAHRVEALLDLGAVHRRAQQALAQQAAAHAGQGLIEHAEYGELGLRRAGIGGEDRLEQFEIAHRDGVEHHGIGAVVIGGAVEMVEGGALRVAQVVQDGAGGADGGGAVGQAAAIEREQFEVIAQRAVGVVVGKDPVFEFGAHEARPGALFAGEQSGRSVGKRTSRAPMCSSAPATSAGAMSVTLNSPVETSTCATPERAPRSQTAARKLFSRERTSVASMAVPGVTTRMISRFTSPLADLGSSTWSQMATRCPFWIRREM